MVNGMANGVEERRGEGRSSSFSCVHCEVKVKVKRKKVS